MRMKLSDKAIRRISKKVKAQEITSLEEAQAWLDGAGIEDEIGISTYYSWTDSLETFTLKRKSRNSYVLYNNARSRWGTKDQILEDLSHLFDTGSLPESPPGSNWH